MVKIDPDLAVEELAAIEAAGATKVNVSFQWVTDFDWIQSEMSRVSQVLGLTP